MTQDEIIKLARQASIGNEDRNIFFDFLIEELEAFAHLVAEHEREACARVCDDINTKYKWPEDTAERVASQWCADAIRARGQA